MRYEPLLLVLLALQMDAFGSSISLTISNTSQNISPGATAIFSGTVTNGSGADLDTTDFFVNAFGFEPTLVDIEQLLGTPDLLVPNGSTSPTLDLFSITLSDTAQLNTSYGASIFLEDINSDQSSILNVSVQASAVPEPGTAACAAIALFVFCCFFRWSGIDSMRAKFLRKRAAGLGSEQRTRCGPGAASLLIVLSIFLFGRAPLDGQSVVFSTGIPAVSLTDADDIAISLPLVNSGSGTASNVQVTKATLTTSVLSNPSLPLTIGLLSPSATNAVILSFSSSAFTPGNRALLSVAGSYTSGSVPIGFAVNRFVTIPPIGVNQPQPPASCHCTTNCLAVQITSPASGTNLNTSAVTVQGTVTDTADEVAVSIDGVSALVQGGQFQAANVPVAVGTNTLTATATDSCLHQNTAAAQVTVGTLTPPVVKVTAAPSTGIAPLNVSLTVTVSSANPIVDYEWDFNGDGIIDSSGPTLSTAATTYGTPGLFTATVTAVDSKGNAYSGSLPVSVLSARALNSLLQTRWSSFSSMLASQNIPAALTYFQSGFASQFAPALTALGPQLPYIVSSLGSLGLLSASGGLLRWSLSDRSKVITMHTSSTLCRIKTAFGRLWGCENYLCAAQVAFEPF